MNTYEKVTELIAEWSKPVYGYTKAELAVKIAEACLGWPYVWGGYGQKCTPANRRAYADRSSCPEGEKEQIRKKCPVLSGKQDECGGCTYYPGGCVLFFDCRGFTRWVLARIGISLNGAGATSQYNDSSNWKAKGPISEMPKDQVCCVFMQSNGRMQHTGLYVGGGRIIHCSGTVKTGSVNDKGWTHYAIPNGMEGDVPVPTARPTIRRGSAGDYVKECQNDLLKLGYSVGAAGADGIYGRSTEAAVKAFQANNRLNVDGICGPASWAALIAAVDDEQKPVLYTVTIRHLTADQVQALKEKYSDVTSAREE